MIGGFRGAGIAMGDGSGIGGPVGEHERSQRFGATFGRYRKVAARLIARIVRPHDVEDVVQETYLRLYQASQQQAIRHPRAFMLVTARNVAFNLVGRADALNHGALSWPEPDGGDVDESGAEALLMAAAERAPSVEQQAEADEEFRLFCRAVRTLPPQCRRAFVLKKVYGLSQREVARELDVSEGTVEKHLARGLAACTQFMKMHGSALPGQGADVGAARRRRRGA